MHPNQQKKLDSLTGAWTAAKANEAADPAAYAKAKRDLVQYRRKLRIGTRVAAQDGDAVAQTSTIEAKRKGN